jgi:hypothetical protein
MLIVARMENSRRVCSVCHEFFIPDVLTLLGIIAKDTAVLSLWPVDKRVRADIPRNFYEGKMDVDDSSLLFHTPVPVKGTSVIGSADLCSVSQIAL